jgi:type I restriction enzyme S subunit
MDLHTTASMYPAISTTDLMCLPFLLPDDATIKKVKQQITAAQAARREAHALLEKARQAVEIAIEKNKTAGMALLK